MITVKYLELPVRVDGVGVKRGDNDFLILINTIHPEEVQSKALEHELTHIKLRHFDRDLSSEQQEREVRRFIRWGFLPENMTLEECEKTLDRAKNRTY